MLRESLHHAFIFDRTIHPKAFIAAAALVAAMAVLPTSANANTVDRLQPTAAPTQSVSLIQVAAVTRDEARAARQAFRECRREGTSRGECRQARREYWVNEASGDSTGGGDTGGSDGCRCDD